nr:hypothetical protein [Chitinophaga sp. CB10]
MGNIQRDGIAVGGYILLEYEITLGGDQLDADIGFRHTAEFYH